MTYTLDQLLDQTGISDISGGHLTKKAAAAERQDLSKLAQRLRQAADATPDEQVSAERHQLVEKTAAVEIIGRTIAEIRSFDAPPGQDKTASAEVPDHAVFIKQALEAGYTPEQVAEFLEKQGGFVSRIKQSVGGWRAGRAYQRAATAGYKSSEKMKHATRQFQELVHQAENASPQQRLALLSKLRQQTGAANAHAVIKASGGKNWKAMPEFKELGAASTADAAAKGLPGAKKKALGINVGGTEVGLDEKQLKAIKKPAMYLGGGALAYRAIKGPGDNDQGRRRGAPIIING